MHLWLLCCVLLFATSQGYDWISHQAWFTVPELALPWVVLGGLGLAIASNRDAWQGTVDRATSKTTSATVESSNKLTANSAAPSAAPSALFSSPQTRSQIFSQESISFKIATHKARSESS